MACRRTLLELLPEPIEQCIVCHELAIEQCAYCTACLLYPEAYRRLRSLWTYQDVAARLIKQMKYYGKSEIIPSLISRLENCLTDQQWWQIEAVSWPPWDLVVGLPSTRIRDFQRGFRHTTFMARQVAELLGTQYSVVALRRHGIKPPQVSVLIENRRCNVINSFRASEKRIKNKQILLIDDVCTSGSSAAEASNSLIQNGALSVDVLTLTRSSLLLKNRLVTRGAMHLSKLNSLCYR